MSDADEDGDETVRITGPASPFQLDQTNGGVTQTVDIDDSAESIVLPAGDGVNVIDLRGIVSEVPTPTFTGKVDDEIWLPNQGFHVVFAGSGNDAIRVEDGATGTGNDIVFGGEADDDIETTGGNNRVILGGADDTASMGDGRNEVLGDSGVIDRQAGTLVGVSDAFAGDDFTTSRLLQAIQVNFPGFGALDVVSGEQVNAAVGVPLDSQSRAEELGLLREALGRGGLVQDAALPSSALSEFLGERAQSLFAGLIQAMDDPAMLARIVDGLSFDLELFDEVIRPALEALHEAAEDAAEDEPEEDDAADDMPVTVNQRNEGTIRDVL